MQIYKMKPVNIMILCVILFSISSGFEIMSENSTFEQVGQTDIGGPENSPEDPFFTRGAYANIKLWDDIGENAEDRFGSSVASAGDVDNDGYDDFIIGCKNNDDAGADAGKVYIYRGAKSISKNPFWQKAGEAWNHKFGTSVASAGDVNKDGFDDIIVGAPQYRDGNTYKGKAYIYLGGPSMSSGAFWTCIGEAEGDEYGCSVASAGDVNNDGYDDVIVGAKEHDGDGNSMGKAYVYLGGSEMSGTPFWEKKGEHNSDDYGVCVASAGNVNGDEYDDIIIGANDNDEEEDGAGKAYVHLGGQSISQVPYWERTGEMEYESFGECLASAGDVNNDGYDDVIIGSRKSDESHEDAGKIYVFLGGTPMNLTSFCEINGESKGDEYGYTVASAGDVNGDLYDDIIVGSLFNDDGGKDAGKAYAYLGGTSINESSFWTRTGEKNEDRFAYCTASAGDVNNDGYDDVIVGAIGNDAGGNNAGKCYVYAIMKNNPPEVSNLTIGPLEAGTMDNLTAHYNFTDPDHDVENGTVIRWYRDGIVVKELNDSLTVNSNYTSKGENWSFAVRPGDGLTNGGPVSSSNRTIINSPPLVSNLLILPTDPKTSDALSIDYTFHDADNDNESGSTIRWYRNGSLVEDFNDLLDIPASATLRNMRWNATLIPCDGEEFGQIIESSEIIIGNSLPTAFDTFIHPSHPKTGDDLTALWNFSDPDNDNETGTEIRWYRNGVHMDEYDDHLVLSSNATKKKDVWHFTVRPGDGEEHGPPLTSPDTSILNTPPTCSPDSPVNGTIFFSDKVLLTWNGTDADNDSLTYNVYLDNDHGMNKIVSDLDHAYWEVTDLVNGPYYWRVEAFDGDNLSEWMFTPLSFMVNVTSENFVPVVRLDSPENNSIINDTTAELRWTPVSELAEFLTYDVYFGTGNAPPLLTGNITSINYSVEELKDETVYYWTIIPRLGDMEGTCIGGTYTFEVRKGFIPVHDVRLSLEREKIRIIKGAVGSVYLEMENLGNVHETVNISVTGSLKDRIVFTPLFNMGPDETETTTISIITNDRMEPGSHVLTISASYAGGVIETELEVVIIDEEVISSETSSGSSWLWWAVGAVSLVTALVIILLLYRSGKKKRSEDVEEVFADIEHVPAGGIRSEMPAAQIIAQKREPPSMAASIQYGYIRREPMMRGPLETLAGMQSSEEQLTGVGFEQYLTGSLDNVDATHDVEAGSVYPVTEGVAVPVQSQQVAVVGQSPPVPPPRQPQLPQATGPDEVEPDVAAPYDIPIPQPLPAQNSGNGTSEPDVTVPPEEKRTFTPLEQAKLPPAQNSEGISGFGE